MTVTAFISEFLNQFFIKGFFGIFKGIGLGIANMFNIPKYIEIFKANSANFKATDWIIAILTVIATLAILAVIVILIVILVKKYLRVRKTLVDQEELLNEVSNLNREIIKLSSEKERILAMKVSQLGLKPGESPFVENTEEEKEEEGSDEEDKSAEDYSRFYKCTQVDLEIADYVAPDFDNEITLPEICDRFRNFACSQLGLFYEPKLIRLFVSAFATTRLIILQGISGTGKTSLPYSFGKFLQVDTTIASVQPSWRDRTELFGYFNEFTKNFNETEVLKRIYSSNYNNDINLILLDEMNIARVEYYFAEMLSILEMPNADEWELDIVPNTWSTDPVKLDRGKIVIPQNIWYIGTANNDDSTYAISDKVYDRAQPINLDSKGVAFEAPDTPPLTLGFDYLDKLFREAFDKYPISQENLKKIQQLDLWVIEKLRVAFGNRILKQMNLFVPVFVACGGDELEGIDYVLATKIFRKFESLNLAMLREELRELCVYINKSFGKNKMNESIAYLERLQKLF